MKMEDTKRALRTISREQRFEGLLNEDEEYRKMLKAVHSMELEYDTLELNPDMKTMIDKLLAERDGINMEKTSLAYWAGILRL